MTVFVQMRDQLDVVAVEGSFEKLCYDINFQVQQGKKLVAVQTPDGNPLAINVDNINTMKGQSLEDAFFPSP